MRDSTHKRSALLISYVFNPNNYPEIGGGGYMASAILAAFNAYKYGERAAPDIRMVMVHRCAYDAYDSDVEHRQKKKRKFAGKLANSTIS